MGARKIDDSLSSWVRLSFRGPARGDVLVRVTSCLGGHSTDSWLACLAHVPCHWETGPAREQQSEACPFPWTNKGAKEQSSLLYHSGISSPKDTLNDEICMFFLFCLNKLGVPSQDNSADPYHNSRGQDIEIFLGLSSQQGNTLTEGK